MTRNSGSDGPMEWVAAPPGDGARPSKRREGTARPAYTGPPSYPAVPRWGFPLIAWRWPLALPSRQRVDPVERVLALSSTAIATLWITVGLASIATVSEIWRYALLLRSRSVALSKTNLVVSDALVATAGVMTWLFALLCGVVVVLWALRARAYAHERAAVVKARPDWQFVAGVLIPGINLFVPGSVLAELEHTVLLGAKEREPQAPRHVPRPTPSRLVMAWWAAWATSLVLGWTTFFLGFRDSVQAKADGVVLHAFTDAVVVILAVLTVLVIKRMTRLLTPVDTAKLPGMRVTGVRGAPSPPRRQRPSDASR